MIALDWTSSVSRGTAYANKSFNPLRVFWNYNGSWKPPGTTFQILVAIDNSQIMAVACFIYRTTIRRYEIATRRLFDLPVKEVSLFGSCVPGQPSEEIVRKFFKMVIEKADFDLISVGELLIGSPLYNAITKLGGGVIAWRASRKRRRWLIRLPASFDEYIASLRPTAKRHISRDCRKFERASPTFRVMQHPEEVNDFLRDAEKVSWSTYQWKFGYGLRNDTRTREKLIWFAKNGTLRCYLSYLQGEPCAFGWGVLNHRTFDFRQTGYNPQYRSLSAGTALIIRMIHDLIENTNCEVFDFLWGGDTGYKSRLGTDGLSCGEMRVAQMLRPYSLLIVALDQTINLARSTAISLAGFVPSAVRRRLRGIVRSYGVGTF